MLRQRVILCLLFLAAALAPTAHRLLAHSAGAARAARLAAPGAAHAPGPDDGPTRRRPFHDSDGCALCTLLSAKTPPVAPEVIDVALPAPRPAPAPAPAPAAPRAAAGDPTPRAPPSPL